MPGTWTVSCFALAAILLGADFRYAACAVAVIAVVIEVVTTFAAVREPR